MKEGTVMKEHTNTYKGVLQIRNCLKYTPITYLLTSPYVLKIYFNPRKAKGYFLRLLVQGGGHLDPTF